MQWMPLRASPGSYPILSALRNFLTSRSPTSLYLGGGHLLSTFYIIGADWWVFFHNFEGLSLWNCFSASKFSLNSKCLTRALLRRLASFVYSVKAKLVLIMRGWNFHVICAAMQICTGSESVCILGSVLGPELFFNWKSVTCWMGVRWLPSFQCTGRGRQWLSLGSTYILSVFSEFCSLTNSHAP